MLIDIYFTYIYAFIFNIYVSYVNVYFQNFFNSTYRESVALAHLPRTTPIVRSIKLCYILIVFYKWASFRFQTTLWSHPSSLEHGSCFSSVSFSRLFLSPPITCVIFLPHSWSAIRSISASNRCLGWAQLWASEARQTPADASVPCMRQVLFFWPPSSYNVKPLPLPRHPRP